MIFATVDGPGMRQIAMMHDPLIWRLTGAVGFCFSLAVTFGYVALTQIDFRMGIFGVSDALEKTILKWMWVLWGLMGAR
eukprot:SAG22_NODE_11745_length_471_cov_0.801075_2_plen_79_part_00